MRVENTEKVLERLREELAWARGKSQKWQARVKELEEQVQEKENLLILRAVRSVAPSPEQLRGLLDQIKGVHGPSIVLGAAGLDGGTEPPDVSDAETGFPELPDAGPDLSGTLDTGQKKTSTAGTAPKEQKGEQEDED